MHNPTSPIHPSPHPSTSLTTPLPLHQPTRPILRTHHTLLPLLTRHTTRRTAITRRDVERRVLGKEVARAQQQRHGLGRHDGEVFGGGEVRDAEGVPENDVFVGDGCVAVGDPFGEAFGGLPGGLGHVAPGGVELVVGV
jgi:hypothetical protein